MSLSDADTALFAKISAHAEERILHYRAIGTAIDRALEFTLGEITNALDEHEFQSPRFARQLSDLGIRLTELYRHHDAQDAAQE